MIAGILAPAGSGGTFFDWTLHYLAGDNEHLVVDIRDYPYKSHQAKWYVIPDDPLQNLTAHGHLKTHPMNKVQLLACLDILRGKCQSPLHSFYFIDSMGPNVRHTCYQEIITANPDVRFFSFQFQEHMIDHLFVLQIEKLQGYWDKLIAEVLDNANSDEMPIWEKRELLALYYFESLANQILSENFVSMSNHSWINWQDFIYRFDTKIPEIFDWLGIAIDHRRWTDWIAIYHRWQHTLNIEFVQLVPHLILHIVNNSDFDLTRFNMTTAKEIVLERRLLYQHNMSIRSYGWQKFPSNTQDWHRLLEPNVYHKL